MLGSNLLFEHKQANAIMQSAIHCIHVTSINGFLGDLTAAFLCQSVKVCLKNKRLDANEAESSLLLFPRRPSLLLFPLRPSTSLTCYLHLIPKLRSAMFPTLDRRHYRLVSDQIG